MKTKLKSILFLIAFARHSCRQRLDGVYRYAAKLGMKIRVVENAYTRTDLKELIEFWNPDGLICSCGFGVGDFDIRELGDIPVVYYDASGCTGRSIAVQSDSEQIGRVAAQELMRLPCLQFAYVPYFDDLHWSKARGDAFKETVKSAGQPCEAFSFSGDSAAKRISALADFLASLPRPCGVFAANDLVAEEVEFAAERAGLRIPRDIALVSVDNHEQLCINQNVPLTSVQIDWEQGGYLATEKLAGLIDGTYEPGGVFLYHVLRVVRRMSTRILPTPADGGYRVRHGYHSKLPHYREFMIYCSA